jgi:hypothetical protein
LDFVSFHDFSLPSFLSFASNLLNLTCPGPYMVFNMPDGKKVYVLWQIAQDAVVDFLSV